MDDNRKGSFDRHQLRQQAIERLRAKHGQVSEMQSDELESLVHELEVYQVELEIQNEELRRTEQALAQALERYRDLYDHAPVAYITLDADGRVVEANRAAIGLCSMDHDAMEGRLITKLAHADERERLQLVLRSAASTGNPQTTEFRLLRGRATPRWVQAEIAWLRREERPGYRVLLVDVTARVQTNAALLEQRSAALRSMDEAEIARARAEKATAQLRESEERFRLSSDAGGALVYQLDLVDEQRITVHGLERVTGYAPLQEITAEWWYGLIHPDDIAAHRENLARRADAGAAYFSIYRMRRRDGTWILVEDTGQVVRDPSGKPVKMVGAIVDVTERRRAEDALREADRRKDEFLATLAHELRNPLAPIRNAAQILRRSDPGAPEVRWARDVIDRQIDQMSRLVDDLLDVSRITRGKIELRRQRVSLRSVVDVAIEATRPLIEHAGHKLLVDIPEHAVILDADPTRLSQALLNLLNNAVKYTPRGGTIRLSATREGKRVVIRIKDTGIGMRPEFLPHVFEMFMQGDTSIEQRQGGIGIGLTLVRRLIEMHGGDVEAQSEGPGKGSEFTITLPVLRERSLHHEEPSEPSSPAEQELTPRSILVVDDNRDSADSMAIYLRLFGHDVHTAHDGPAALEEATTFRPSIILLDIGLPGMNGYDVARQIKTQRGKGVLLIAMTGWGQEEDRQRAREAGFDHHLTKPVDFEALNSLLSSRD